MWCSIGTLLWLAALAAGYGGLDTGLSRFKSEPWAPVAAAAYFGSVSGAWVGSAVGPVVVGASRRRRPVLTSSFLAAAVGGASAATGGAALGWLLWRGGAGLELALKATLWFGAAAGALAGVCAGWAVGHPRAGVYPAALAGSHDGAVARADDRTSS
ncbi:hypothetical protein [Gemmata obscuriglobus]|uniref:Uncharacterized protein n=1 Tax=Gemmata obscuriglobus TaxID=114 RepID=A0A2Z3H582_9BACT|nr:hypothetical protein [Gemmata obscuriglobus]AWM40868.1 hypothetical protein C1280_30345 [Gemmata obscuriglobus]